MTMDQLEGNEPLHENFGTELGEEIDEVNCLFARESSLFNHYHMTGRRSTASVGQHSGKTWLRI